MRETDKGMKDVGLSAFFALSFSFDLQTGSLPNEFIIAFGL